MEGYPPPYYIGLRVADMHSEELRCSMGAVRVRNEQHQRLLTADVHVGSYALDNHPMVPSAAYNAQELPLDGDEFSIRHQIWQELDEHYKAASAEFLRNEALHVRRGKTEYDTDDWTREPALSLDIPGALQRVPVGMDGERLCIELSRLFRADSSVLNARVTLEISAAGKRFFDSQGTRERYGKSVVRLGLDAGAITADGMGVFGARSFMAPRIAELPARPVLEQAVRGMLADLAALRAASSTSPFSAPALLDPSVSADVVEAFATRLAGEQQRNPEGAQTFRGKIGKKVLPEFLTLVDDPKRREFNGVPLVGRYDVDEEGVRAQSVTLVDRGILRHYLLSRYPVLGISRSNGHGRAAAGHTPMGRVANLFLRSKVVHAPSRLLELLMEECRRQGKPFGIWIQKARAWRQQDTTNQQQAFRLQPTLIYLVDAQTGERTLVRDLDMVGTPLDLLGKILAVGDDLQVSHASIEEASGNLAASSVAPTLLLQEVELQRAESKPERPPVLPPPVP